MLTGSKGVLLDLNVPTLTPIHMIMKYAGISHILLETSILDIESVMSLANL